MIFIALYDKEKKKGVNVKGGVKMENFIKEVLLAEKGTGGDRNIFDQISKELEEELNKELNLRMITKELFVTSKSASKKKRNERKSLVEASKTPNRKLDKSEYSSVPLKRGRFSMSPISGKFFCHGRCGKYKCQFNSNNDFLKIHIEEGTKKKNSPRVKRLKTNVQASSSKSSAKKVPRKQVRRNSNKKDKTDSKSAKIEEMILDDWREDDNDQDESLEINRNVVAETTSTISTSNTIFDFDDDDDNSVSIENLRHMKNTSSLLENSENKIIQADSSCGISGKSESDSPIPVDNENKTILEDKKTIVEVNNEEKKRVEDSISMDMSGDGPTKSVHFNCLQEDNLPGPDWVKETSWDICAPGYNKGKN